MKKIIYILCHTLYNDQYRDYHVFGTFQTRQARAVLARTKTYQCECWYAIKDLPTEQSVKKDGIVFRLFPAKTLHKALESFFGIIYTPALLAALEKEDPNNVVIHFHGERGSILHQLLSKYPQYKVVLQYHGYGQPWWLEWFEKITFTQLEKRNFKHIQHFFNPIKPRTEYLEKYIGIDQKKISPENIGVDFERFKPRDKQQARTQLNIPLDRFVMMYVGPMIASKGVDKIIETYRILKIRYPQLYLLFIGAKETDPLYSLAKQHADKIIPVAENTQMPFYYNAADVYCFFGNQKIRKYAGPGIATIEALASNLNVVSTNLAHFPDQIVEKVGYIPQNLKNFQDKLEFLIQHPRFQYNARDLVAPYTANQYIFENIIRVYDQLFTQ